MTTIAIDHNTISADGRSTEGDFVAEDNRVKVNKIGDLIYGYAGSVPDGETLIDIVVNGAEAEAPSLDCYLITIQNNVPMCHVLTEGKLSSWQINPPYAIGSGKKFAITAMDMGKTSREAVKYAATRDVYTGGKIKTIKWGN